MDTMDTSEIPLKKTYDPRPVEARWYAFWLERGYFHADEQAAAPPFSMVIPPPNITGSLHMGHALNNVLQDILARWKRMCGYNVLWMPGTDHAGIATQNVVERQLAQEGLTRQALGREAFVQRVWQWKQQSGGTIVHQLKRLGASCDWARERFTLDEGLSAAVREVFVRLHEEGLIYRGDYIINWCPRCQTALSDLEVEHHEVAGKLYHIRYPWTQGQGGLVVATTRPETLLGDTAVAVHPQDRRYSKHVGRLLRLPLTDREIPLIADEAVDPKFGTGAVKVTPAHDPHDFEIAQRHGLPARVVMGEDGRMNEEAGRYRGLDRFACRQRVLRDLDAQGLLVKTEEHSHAVGHCYRCKTVVEPYLSKQWFVRVQPLAGPALEAVQSGRIRIIPKTWEATYVDWMTHIRDWCISRQIWWGHRIPAWHCAACGQTTVARTDPNRCAHCGSAEIAQETDVLDTWFSSALWPFSTMGWPQRTRTLEVFYPTTVLVTGFDILFFWVARMIMMGLKFMGDVPFRDVYIHALVRDAEGQKMSKSRGNVIDPLEVMDRHGTDAFRFTLAAMAAQGRDIRLAEERIEGYRHFCTKLWNAARFVHLQLSSSPEAREALSRPGWTLAADRLSLPDRWILSRLQRVIQGVGKALEEYRFNEAAGTLYQLLWHEYCDWYIELSKPVFQEADPQARTPTLQVLVTVLETTLRLLHPFMPFLTEELWQSLPHQGESVTVASYPVVEERYVDPAAETQMAALMEIITAVRNVRNEVGIAPGLRIPLGLRPRSTQWLALLQAHGPLLQRLARVDRLEVGMELSRPPRSAVQLTEAAELYVPLAGLVDLQAETERIQREMDKLDRDITALNRKLSNPEFIQRAPAEVVARDRNRREALLQKKATLEESLRRLASLQQEPTA